MRTAHANGIAMVTVLMILSSVLVLGIASLVLTNSNLLISENLIGNSIARSNAESGIDATVTLLASTFRDSGTVAATGPALPQVYGVASEVSFGPAGSGWYEKLSDDRVFLQIVGYGPRNAEFLAEALIEFRGAPGGGLSPFQGAFIACENVDFGNSMILDSFDSRLGPYSSGSRRHNADVLAMSPTGGVRVHNSSEVYGSVSTLGDVDVGNSAQFHGNVHANGDVSMRNSATFHGSLATRGSVSQSNSSQIRGNLQANGDLSFKNSATVLGNVQVGGSIAPGDPDDIKEHIKGGSIRPHDSPEVPLVEPEDCDPLNIAEEMLGLRDVSSSGQIEGSTGSNYLNWEISPTGVRAKTKKKGSAWVDIDMSSGPATILDQNVNVLRLSKVALANSGSLRITGGDVVLFVDGDFTASNSSQLIIDEGSTLTLFITGTVRFSNSFKLVDDSVPGKMPKPVNANGDSVFTIYSSNAGRNGVQLGNSGELTASIYAPLTDVDLGNSGEIQGALRAKNIEISNSMNFHFDEALRDVAVGGGGTSGAEPTVRILGRR